MKKILAIVGSYRKGKTIDTLIDRAIQGVESIDGVQVEKIYLIEKNIKYCTNCMVCKKDDAEKSIARCKILLKNALFFSQNPVEKCTC